MQESDFHGIRPKDDEAVKEETREEKAHLKIADDKKNLAKWLFRIS